jgi:chromate transporter
MLMAVAALVILSMAPLGWIQPLVILIGGVIGIFIFKEPSEAQSVEQKSGMPLGGIIMALLIFVVLLIIPLAFHDNQNAQGTGGLLRAGALVFGGGHVVLPLLETSTVVPGLVGEDAFLAGYGAAQAVPGPLFTFGSFLGADMQLFGSVWRGGAVGTIAIFLPGMVLLAGGLPVWNRLKHFAWARAGVKGANAVVVGVLGAALFGMLRGGSVQGFGDASGIVLIAFAIYFKWLPIWALVIISAVVGGIVF